MEVAPWALWVLGLCVGMISGLLGVGGGVLMTPALHILGLSLPLAIGTTLTQMVASSIVGTWKHWSQGHVSWRLVLLFGLPGLAGVVLGKELMVALAEDADILNSLPLYYAGFFCLLWLV